MVLQIVVQARAHTENEVGGLSSFPKTKKTGRMSLLMNHFPPQNLNKQRSNHLHKKYQTKNLKLMPVMLYPFPKPNTQHYHANCFVYTINTSNIIPQYNINKNPCFIYSWNYKYYIYKTRQVQNKYVTVRTIFTFNNMCLINYNINQISVAANTFLKQVIQKEKSWILYNLYTTYSLPPLQSVQHYGKQKLNSSRLHIMALNSNKKGFHTTKTKQPYSSFLLANHAYLHI
eukprot:TRINITY_DN861_c0_g1_i8.p4 TRINITY_DN861_c0_g1~~TRINITY_DN861_c0_g1_i8.p4  ORF type:complete len:230 (+),score=-4.79 TRINITY_DN861_c0_g1_i8:1487-2176(+)